MCGVAAVAGPGAPRLVYSLLLELQHRGHEAAGIAYLAGRRVVLEGGLGLVYEAIRPYRLPSQSSLAVGHVRYSTSGPYSRLYQPIVVDAGGVYIAVAFNGNIVNYREVAEEYRLGVADWDAMILAKLLSVHYRGEGSLVDAARAALREVRGSYALVAISSRGELLAVRDPRGIRPLAYSLGEGYAIVASETAALESHGLEWRELPRAWSLYCVNGECSAEQLLEPREQAPCVFEYVYFSRPDSVFEGVEVYEARVRMGVELARMDDVEADVVAPVPDSGRAAAAGYALEKGMPLMEVLYPSRFRGRVFIRPPGERGDAVRRKYGLLRSVVRGRRLVVVDDSIVRGSTAARIVSMLRSAGAREVHFRSASPPVRCPCSLGIDFPRRSELVAHGRSVEEIQRLIGADTLLYNTVDGLRRAVGVQACMACFTCRYPSELARYIERFER